MAGTHYIFCDAVSDFQLLLPYLPILTLLFSRGISLSRKDGEKIEPKDYKE
jgi:hypothetical protein